jgi:hypothetical protein
VSRAPESQKKNKLEKNWKKTGKKLNKSGIAQFIDALAATRSICNAQFITSSIY